MKRVIFVLLVTTVGILASFVDSFYGLLLYAWYSFASPLDLTFGALQGSRLSLVVGFIVIATTLIQKKSLLKLHLVSAFLIAFLFCCFASLAMTGVFDLRTIFSQIELIAKLIAMTLITPTILTNTKKIRLFILVVAISVGVLGAYYGIFGLIAGSKKIIGPGRIGDNNGYAVLLVSSLPFIFFAGKYLELPFKKNFKIPILVGFFLANIVAIMLTFSRGGFLSACLVISLLVLSIEKLWSKILVWGIVVPILILVGSSVFMVNPNEIPLPKGEISDSIVTNTIESYKERLRTLRGTSENIESANSRTHFWKVAIKMAEDNPLFGVGFNRYSHEYDNYDFSGGEYGRSRAVHNTMLSILAETGYTGMFVFFLIVISSLFSLFLTKRRCRQEVEQLEQAKELVDYVKMIRISMFGFFFGSFFVTCLFQELLWTLFALTVSIDFVSKSLLQENASE